MTFYSRTKRDLTTEVSPCSLKFFSKDNQIKLTKYNNPAFKIFNFFIVIYAHQFLNIKNNMMSSDLVIDRLSVPDRLQSRDIK